MTAVASCPSKDVLVTALYGEAAPEERQQLERHLAACAACREEFDALGALRLALQEWDAPAPSRHRPLVVSPISGALDAQPPAAVVAGPARWWTSRGLARAALAAAATLVLGAAAGLANLDITVGPQGLSVKTGRGHSQPAEGAPAPAAVRAPAPPPAGRAGAARAAGRRSELAALEQRLLAQMEARVASAPGPSVALASSRAGDQALLRQVQDLIDAAETRQQRNLAQRVTELAREFDVQRKSDLVTIQHGLGQLEGRTQAEVARTREMMNLLVRTSGGGAPQR